jgi:hypothetical protein
MAGLFDFLDGTFLDFRSEEEKRANDFKLPVVNQSQSVFQRHQPNWESTLPWQTEEANAVNTFGPMTPMSIPGTVQFQDKQGVGYESAPVPVGAPTNMNDSFFVPNTDEDNSQVSVIPTDPIGATPPPPVEEPGFFDKIGSGMSDFFGDEERMARMTIALNSMRLNPDPNIAKSMENKLESLRKGKGKNATVIQLRAKGRDDLADAVESGSMKATTAWTIAFREQGKPTTLAQKIALYEADPDKYAEYVDKGVISKGSTTNVNLGGNAYDKTASTGFAEDDRKVVNLAKASPAIIQKAESVKELLNSGAINTGWLSDFKQGIDKVAVSLGGKEALMRLSNTELMIALTGSDVFPMIKQLGIGARGLDTPAEREFLLAVMVGTATMTKETLLKMTQRRIDIAERNIGIYNSYLSEGKLDKYQKNREYKFQPISSKNVIKWSDM